MSRGLSSTVGIVIVLAVILLGGLYFWSKRGNDYGNNKENATTTSEYEASAATDAELEAELNSFESEIDGLDSELDGK